MEFLKNFKTEHKILSFFFIFSFLVFIFCHYHFKEGLFFDQPSMFITTFSSYDESFRPYFLFMDNRIRFFNNLLVAIPFNILAYLYKTITHQINILNFLCLFTSSYFIIHIFALITNLLVAIRTKRYDIAIIGFTFYTLFSLINMIWAVREIHITILFYFPLLSYFLSKEKLGKKDLIPVIFLIIYMFESFEISIIYGFILQLFACLYTILKKDDNLLYKNIIGSGCFFASIYIFAKMCFWLPKAAESSQVIDNAIEQYVFAITFYTQNFIYTSGLITVAGIILILFILFYKKKLSPESIIPIFLFWFVTGVIMWKCNQFHVDSAIELNAFGWTVIFIFPIILFILISDYFKLDLNKFNPNFFDNLYTVACIIGILHLFWQIHTCFEFNEYVSYIKNVIETSNERLIEIKEEEIEANKCLAFHNNYGIVHQSALLNPNNTVEKIIIPSEYKNAETNWYSSERTGIDEEGTIHLHDAITREKHFQYFNPQPIVEYIQENLQEKEN